MKTNIADHLKFMVIGALLPVILLSSCQKYLDARPDKTQEVPASLQDLQALLDNAGVMNRLFPAYGEGAADNYYLTQASYNTLGSGDKGLYTWQPDAIVISGQWTAPYKVVYYANQVLESLGKLNGVSAGSAAAIKGAAYFFRGYAFLQVAGIFAPQYNPATAAADLGIPLRLSADPNPKSVRSTNAQAYAQILSDLKQSISLLPLSSAYPSRPTRIAAYATIARTLLSMGDYVHAGLYTDSCLALSPQLMDFNTLDAASPNPIARFNTETLFYAMSGGANALYPATCEVDSALYVSYAANDLRKAVYFKSNGDGTYAFKGNYDGAQSSAIFSGPATDELYLIAAECAARAGDRDKALLRLNSLLVTRYRAAMFVPLTAPDANSALSLILTERRKELIFRALRWTDLKRLNLEVRFKTTLQRKLGTATYELPPGDPRYALLIPQEVISQSGMPQNPRK